MLLFVPDHLQKQQICDNVVRGDPSSLQYVPDLLMTKRQVKVRRNHKYYCNDDELIQWYNGYKKGKAQKAQIKKELMPVAQHPDRMMDWCMSEDEKRRWKVT